MPAETLAVAVNGWAPGSRVSDVSAADIFAALYAGCDGLVEVRHFPPGTHGKATQVWFRPDQAAEWAATCKRLRTGRQLFWGVATRKDDTSGKAANCLQLPAVWIDIDKLTPDVERALAMFPLQPSLTVATGRGRHAYWFLREPLDLTDAEAHGGAVRLLKGLAHTLHGDPSVCDIPRILRIPRSRNLKAEPIDTTILEFDPDRLYTLADFDEYVTWIETPQNATPRETPTQASRPTSDDHAHVLARARAYLAAVPPAIEGQGGDQRTFTTICAIVRGFDLSDSDALDVLRDWNARCAPPWTERELQAKIDGARRYGEEAFGGRLDDPKYARQDTPDRARTARATPQTQTPVEAGDEDEVKPAPDSGAYHYTDSGNAEFFAAREGRQLRFDHQRGRWLQWDTHRWRPDVDGAVMRLAKDAMRARLTAATALTDDDKRKTAVRWALQSESRGRLDALIHLSRAESPLATAGGQWDRDPWLLAVGNGVIDLRRGQLRAGTREDGLTMGTDVPFDPHATCPRWERFIREVFADDADLVAYIHRAVGYALTGDTSEQCLFLLYGRGANGKGTFSNTLKQMLGAYADNMPFSTIEQQQRAAIPNDLAALVGRRFVVASETNDGTRLNEARIKALTGCDPITARFLHGEFFTFTPVAKFWLSVNHKPVVRDDSHGFWRRMRLIPFTCTFSVDPHLSDTLRSELPGILAWAVRGCLAWQQHGLTAPASVVGATEQYAFDSDPLAAFLEDAFERCPDAIVGSSEIYEHYKLWANLQGLSDRERLTHTRLGKMLGERFERTPNKRRTEYIGLVRRALTEEGCA